MSFLVAVKRRYSKIEPLFHIRGSVALAETINDKLNRDTGFQYSIINATVIQIGKDEFENVAIIGSGDAGVEHTFGFWSIIEHLAIFIKKKKMDILSRGSKELSVVRIEVTTFFLIR